MRAQSTYLPSCETLQRCLSFLPTSLRAVLVKRYWQAFWQAELKAQQRSLGVEAAQDLRGSERAVLVEALASAWPFASVFELGCGYAQLFQVLAPLFPSVKFFGVDKDELRVEAGKYALAQAGLHNVQLSCLSAAQLAELPGEQFDVVCSSACLLYIPPEEIEDVLRQLLRLSRKKLILLEQEHEAEDRLMPATGGMPAYWQRSYKKLLEKIAPQTAWQIADWQIERVPNALWQTEDWQNSATLFRSERREKT